MTELDAFIVRGHEKIIAHYRWLRDTSASEEERARFQQCVVEEEKLLRHFVTERSIELPRAA
jgi:hypothetical protein